MLKFLTHKLRTHSLNEEHPSDKVENEEHDSGTESDENENSRDSSEFMMDDGSRSSCSPASLVQPGTTTATTPSPYFLDSGLPSDCDLTYEHHSSEEELEVINSQLKEDLSPLASSSRSRSTSTLPEKRKWSQVNEESEKRSRESEEAPSRRPLSRVLNSGNIFLRREHSSSSSDDEVHVLTACSTPVKFRTEPPVDVHKPGHRSHSPPVKLFHYGQAQDAPCPCPCPCPADAPLATPAHTTASSSSSSPRKRHRHKLPHKAANHPSHLHRPCLDFEKMQQLKARAVTTWRPSTEHGGELSVFCW